MRECGVCGKDVRDRYRFCPWCGTPQRRKVVQFFPASSAVDDESGKALRVSRYLRDRHVRFSVWDDTGAVEAAVSLDDDETARLALFLGSQTRRASLIDDLRTRVLGR